MNDQKKIGVALFAFYLAIILFPAAVAAGLPSRNIFSDNSFWYKEIPTDVTLHENSAGFVTDFLRQKTKYYGNVNINMTSYASPVYYTDNQKTTTVIEWNCQHKSSTDKSLAEQWANVPIPPYAIPADGTDAEMSIYDLSTDTLWDFWKVRNLQGQWQACWGGRILNASQSDGVFNKYYGATATSLPFIGGQITAEELSAGEIKHVIGISMVDLADRRIFSWPAHRSDGYNPLNAPNRIPEGLRFRLDPRVDVDQLPMHPIGKIIAKAAQKYGFVVWDHAGALSLRAQNPYSYTAKGLPNPYLELFAGTKGYAILNGFPWERLQFLPMNYGQPQ
jgi:hypothetical protein